VDHLHRSEESKLPTPDAEVMQRRIRVEIEFLEQISLADRDRVITVVVAQTLAETGNAE